MPQGPAQITAFALGLFWFLAPHLPVRVPSACEGVLSEMAWFQQLRRITLGVWTGGIT